MNNFCPVGDKTVKEYKHFSTHILSLLEIYTKVNYELIQMPSW